MARDVRVRDDAIVLVLNKTEAYALAGRLHPDRGFICRKSKKILSVERKLTDAINISST